MLGASSFLLSFWYLILGGLIGLIIVLVSLSQTPAGRRFLDRLKLNLPLIGPLVRKSAILRFARPFAILHKSGVNIITSLEIIRKTTGNVILQDIFSGVSENVQKGGTIADPLRTSREIPPMVYQMIAVGEETGDLDTMLDALSENYEYQLEYSTRRLITLIEPILLAVIACVVAFLMLAVYLPIFSMMKIFSK
jgi:type IV pilus assembly protein PilC